MKNLLILGVILLFMNINFGQDLKTLIADGTAEIPPKYDLEPRVSELATAEIEAVKTEALRTEISFETLPQTSSEESNFRKDFELLDVAEGFFIYREIEFRAYLYTAYSQKMKRNYQGILVLDISNNGTKFTPKAHYVYAYRGDKYLRQLSDINGNVLSELAIFSEPPTKKYFKKDVRIIEFSAEGVKKLGIVEIYSKHNNKQKTPKSLDKNKSAKQVYIPSTISAVKLFADKKLTGNPIFNVEEFSWKNDVWKLEMQFSLASLQPNKTEYIEIVKPIFPKGIGEK